MSSRYTRLCMQLTPKSKIFTLVIAVITKLAVKMVHKYKALLYDGNYHQIIKL